MRQFIGSVRDDTTVQRFLVDLSPPAVRAAWDAMEAAELALMEVDDERGQMSYAHALSHWGDVGGYEAEVTWDTVTVAALGIPYDNCKYRELSTLSRRGAEAAGAGGAAARPRRGPAARRAGQLPRRPRQAVARGAAARHPEDRALRQPRPRAARPRRRPRGHRRGRVRLGARRRLRQLPRGPDGAARAAGRAAAALGRGAPAADRPRAHPAAAGGQLTRHGQPVPRDADPAGEVRGGRAAAGPAARAEGRDAAAGRAYRRARGHRRAAGADRPDEAVRPRDLVRRPGRRPRGERCRASRTSCGCSRASR